MSKLIPFLVILLCSSLLWANTPIKSFEEEYFDYLVLTDNAEVNYLNHRTLSSNSYLTNNNRWENSATWTNNCKNDFSITVYNPHFFISENTKQPYGQNDGSLWQGKGINFQFSTGATLKYKGFELTFKPEINFSQNKPYKTMHDTNSYFWGSLDLVQRYGDKSTFNFNFGDSNIKYIGNYIEASLGTETIWIGPTYLNSILMSNNAPNYVKFEIGLIPTNVTFPWTSFDLGKFEIYSSIGMLKTSKYYKVPNNKTFLAMINIGYQPSFINNLTIGANYVDHFDLSWKSFKNVFKTALFGHNIEGDGKMSYSLNWCIPNVGLDIYAEYGKDDYSYFNFYHTSVIQLGFKKSINIFETKGINLELIGEFGNMEMSRDALSQWSYNFYTHGSDHLSYSNDGQLLGAGTGYAGVSYFLKLNSFYKKGMSSIFAQLHHPDNNYTYQTLIYDYHLNKNKWGEKPFEYHRFKRSLDLGISSTYFINNHVTVEAGFVDQIIVNNFYLEDFDSNLDYPYQFYSNCHFNLGLTYSF